MIYGIVVASLLPLLWLAVLSATAKRPTNLGAMDGRLAACPDTPNCVSTQATDVRHHIEPIAFDGDARDALVRLEAAMGTIPRMRIVTEKEDYIHAEATSRIFRFVDDVECFLDRDTKVIHFRSASRVGRSDFGVNRARMEQIRAAFAK